MKTRLITGPILIALIVGLVWFDARLETARIEGGWRTLFEFLGWHHYHPPRGIAIFGLALLLVPLIAFELAHLLERAGLAARPLLAMVAATVTFVAMTVLPYVHSPRRAAAAIATLLVVMLVLGLVRFSRHQTIRGVMGATGGLLLVCVYAGVLPAFWMYVRHEHSAWILVGAILTTKSCDIGAYFTGVSIGRHKLIPWLSPGKTWEGLVGGVVTAAAVGAGLALLSERLPAAADNVSWLYGAFVGAILALLGQFGDLAESLFKREAGVKDSGGLVPGMGGLLDVVDSPLMTGPAVYWLLLAASAS